MKFVTITDLRRRPAAVWKTLKAEGELVLTSNGKAIAIFTSVTQKTLESTLAVLRRDRAVRAVREIQRDSVRRFPKGMSLREINAEIRAVRAKRPR